jgi:hypothetical protein
MRTLTTIFKEETKMEKRKMWAIEDKSGNRVPFARYEINERDWAEEDLVEIYIPKYGEKAGLHIVEIDHI